ncbi:uncharacterized protein DS421_10g307320 [Arachis hypogaea]|nr:uncharacterized protein DS421_10g307320 [Arachis hypogaea]
MAVLKFWTCPKKIGNSQVCDTITFECCTTTYFLFSIFSVFIFVTLVVFLPDYVLVMID